VHCTVCTAYALIKMIPEFGNYIYTVTLAFTIRVSLNHSYHHRMIAIHDCYPIGDLSDSRSTKHQIFVASAAVGNIM